MQKYNVLVLTDHSQHSAENSLYALVRALRQNPRCGAVNVATRANKLNTFFFDECNATNLYVSEVDDKFAFSANGAAFKNRLQRRSVRGYDVVWLRLPPPLSGKFLDYLSHVFADQIVINDPVGIWLTGSKRFLTNFPEWCPPMQLCTSVADIVAFRDRFPIVLKPYREYGGRGIVRIDGDTVWMGQQKTDFANFIANYEKDPVEYLGVQFLKNVTAGDKRIIVVNGKIMGASLRLPPNNSWICNVAMGGSSHFTKVEEREVKMIEAINEKLSGMGIVMYGVDTLTDDNGQRVLSELNTTSIGGLPQIARLAGLPLVKQATDLIWDYVVQKSINKHVVGH
ncbi:MAG: glutathione synthetase [Bacteroidota bacterium]